MISIPPILFIRVIRGVPHIVYMSGDLVLVRAESEPAVHLLQFIPIRPFYYGRSSPAGQKVLVYKLCVAKKIGYRIPESPRKFFLRVRSSDIRKNHERIPAGEILEQILEFITQVV